MFRILLCVSVILLSSSVARADLISFSSGDGFDGAVVGTNVSVLGGQLTVVAINGSTVSTAHNLDTNGASLGVDTGADDGAERNRWDDGESLTFFFNFDTAFEEINFGGFSGGESFSLQSSAFTSLGIGANPSTNVAYDSGSGTFTFGAQQSSDSFTIADIGGAAVAVGSGDTLTLAYSAGGGNHANLQSIGFAAVPEPSGLLLLFAFAAAGALRRRSS